MYVPLFIIIKRKIRCKILIENTLNSITSATNFLCVYKNIQMEISWTMVKLYRKNQFHTPYNRMQIARLIIYYMNFGKFYFIEIELCIKLVQVLLSVEQSSTTILNRPRRQRISENRIIEFPDLFPVLCVNQCNFVCSETLRISLIGFVGRVT